MITLFEKKQLKAIPEDVYYTRTDVSNLVWKPLEEELRGIGNIYFATFNLSFKRTIRMPAATASTTVVIILASIP